MSNEIGRRGTLALVGGLAFGTAGVTSDGETPVRVRGSYGNPVTASEAADARRRLTGGEVGRRVEPVVGDRQEWVEYVVTQTDAGVTQFYGFAASGREPFVHDRAERLTTISQPATVEEAWNTDGTDRLLVADHAGTLGHDACWYRTDGDRHAVVSRVTGADDTLLPYGRFLHADHRWDGQKVTLVNASPNTTLESGSVVGALGRRASERLSFGFDAPGRIRQNGRPPTTTWRLGVPRSGRHRLIAASLVEHERGERSVSLRARATWPPMYTVASGLRVRPPNGE